MKAPTRNAIAAFALICLLVAPVAAQNSFALDPDKRITQYAHTAWRIQDGVLPGLPEAIAQTADGYLWIGTYEGLVRFDGVRFVSWNALHKQQLPSAQIFSLLGARDGSLWVGTAKGLAHWRDHDLVSYPEPPGKIKAIVEDEAGAVWTARSQINDGLGPLCQVMDARLRCYGEADGILFPSANGLVRDGLGNLWVGGPAGLTRWKAGASAAHFENQLTRSKGLMGVIAIAADKDAGVWASIQGASAALDLQHLDQGVWKSYMLPGIGRADPGVSALFIDRDHTVWVGTASRGIYRINGSNVDHFSSDDGLSSNAVAGFYQDREGSLWVATSKGVDRLRDVRVASFSMREGLAADSVSTVLASRDGTVWVGNSGALNFIKDGKIGAIRTGHGLPGRDVTTMFEDHTGRLWIGVDQGLWVHEGGSFRPIAKGVVFALTEDTDQNIWARVGPKLLRIHDLKVRDEISLPEVSKTYAMASDPQGGIWLGLTNGVLARYRSGQIGSFPPNQGANPRQIRALLVDSDGSVLGATDQGVVRLKDGTRNVLSSRNGLPCDEIYTLVKDNAGSLWLYTKCGVLTIASSELEKWWKQPESTINFRSFDVFDGAQPGQTPLQPQATKSVDGRLWFANDSILQMIDPGRLSKNTIPPPVHIEQIVADRKLYLPKENLELPPRTRDLEIDYAALSLAVPQKVRYRYKLEGHDREWQEPGLRRQAFYNDLPPGKYEFSVIACNNDGLWNEGGAAVEFSIVPAFYQTAWFLLLCIAGTAYVGWAVYRWRVGQISRRLDLQFEERLTERTRIAQDLHDTLLQGVLSASMQLHVANEVLETQSPAKPLVGRVLELMGGVVDDGRNAVRGLRSSAGDVDLDQAFSRVPQELAIQQPADFRVIVEGESRALHPVIRDEVYRIGREALSNAFRHSGAGNIEVELEYASHQLRVLVRDNGCGIDPQVLRSGKDGHFGLSGMRERAGRIGAKLKVWSRAGGGTEVELSVPSQVAFRGRPPVRRGWLAVLYPRESKRDRQTRGNERQP